MVLGESKLAPSPRAYLATLPPPGSSPVGVDARGSLAVQHRRLSS